jgi:predicted RNA-binding Zn ribbon-like protein
MIFAHDTEIALTAAAALVNTGRDETDTLRTTAELDEFVRSWEYTGARTQGAAELEAVRQLRSRLAELWDCDEDQAVELVNLLLRENRALPQLVRHDRWDYHIHAVDSGAPLVSRMAVEAAMAFSDVLRMKEFQRLRACSGDDCQDVYIDLSKNRSRRFCSTGCGNRANVAAYRARQG